MLKKSYALIPFIVLLCSCSTMTIDVDYNDKISFSGLKNFGWVPETPVKSNNPRLDSDTILHDRIRGEITNWLLAHGYTENKDEPVNFLIAYQVAVKDKTKVTVINDYYDYPLGWGYGYRPVYGMRGSSRQHVYEYQEGTIVIDIVDPETKKLMWRGSASDEVKADKSPEKRQQVIAEAVDKILQKFPPEK